MRCGCPPSEMKDFCARERLESPEATEIGGKVAILVEVDERSRQGPVSAEIGEHEQRTRNVGKCRQPLDLNFHRDVFANRTSLHESRNCQPLAPSSVSILSAAAYLSHAQPLPLWRQVVIANSSRCLYSGVPGLGQLVLPSHDTRRHVGHREQDVKDRGRCGLDARGRST